MSVQKRAKIKIINSIGCETETDLESNQYEKFKVYINNIYKINIYGEMLLFPNDVAYYIEGENLNMVYGRGRYIEYLKKSDQNLFTLNINKIKCMLLY